MSDKKRLLNDLRVIDLRVELEKRNLDKSGVRGVLIQRLSKYLEEEGHDPASFKFELTTSDAKTPSKRTRRTESSLEQETDDTPVMEDMIVQDDAGEEEETEQSQSKSPSEEQTNKPTMDVDEAEKNSRKRELQEDSEATQAKKPCIEKDKNDDDHKENNTDADDSINLDIGDDELLNEETDTNVKSNKKGQNFMYSHQSSEVTKKILMQDMGSVLVVQHRVSAGRSNTSERPVLPQLTINTDADDGENDDNTGTSNENPAQDTDAAGADSVSAEDHLVNADTSATSNDGAKHDSQMKDEKEKDSDGDKKEKKDEAKEGGARNLWISGLSGDTRAKDLKQLCSKHGKVIGAKVVTTARWPGSRCFGYVTVATAQDAENCIKNLHRTELHGRMISVEKAKSESESSSRRQPTTRTERRPSKEKKEETKENEEIKEEIKEVKIKKEDDVSATESTRSTSRTREKSHRSDRAPDKPKRSTKSNERRRSPREVLSFSKIWKERDVARARERSRAAREEERRRRAAEEALRERERRQRQEKHRLALEREKLRAEREKIEREKNELLRLERERHRLEREKLELERLELKRAQIRLEEERRKRGYETSGGGGGGGGGSSGGGGGGYRGGVEPAYERERHKRAQPPPPPPPRAHFDAPPPPRFDAAPRDRDRDYKRDYPRHLSSNAMKYSRNGGGNDEARQPIPPGTRPKEPSRSYHSRESPSYRPSPPAKPEARWNTAPRYTDSAPPAKGSSGGGGGSSGGGGGGSGEAWSGEPRYAGYEARSYQSYQPPPPGATYPDRYAPPSRDYPRKY